MDCYTGLVSMVQSKALAGDQRAAGLMAALDNATGDQHQAVLNVMQREYMPNVGDREPGDNR